MDLPLAVDVAQAAELTGLSRKAIRRRVERGSLPSTLSEGRRRIPVSELRRAGLLEGHERALSGQGNGRGTPAGQLPDSGTALDAADLLAEVSRLSEQLGHQRAIAAQAQSLERQAETERLARERAEEEAARLRLVVEALESRRWWQRRKRVGDAVTSQ